MTTRESLDAAARASVEDLRRAGLARRPLGVEGVDLLTNDYLGLRRDPRVVAAARDALARAGAGAGAARLLGGDDPEHRALEAAVARLHDEEAGVLFATGSAANLGAIATLAGEGDLLVSERRNHGSLVDGIRLSRAARVVVPDRDVAAVDRALATAPSKGRRFVVVEGVHGMDGDRAPLADLAEVCRRRGALLIVDEAHAVGLIGPDGAGAVAEAGCADVVAARVVPCGKALGAAGGVVTGSAAVGAMLVHRARAYLFATALPPSIAAAARAALEVARAEPWRRARARNVAATIRERLLRLGQTTGGAAGAALVPWILGTPARAEAAAAALRAAGFAVRPVRPPTVPEGTSRVRLSCHADLSEEDLARLLDALDVAVRGLPT